MSQALLIPLEVFSLGFVIALLMAVMIKAILGSIQFFTAKKEQKKLVAVENESKDNIKLGS
ncbi:MAG: hypothetical protein AB9856_04510 [Cellulosilyticaceae bacterium]